MTTTFALNGLNDIYMGSDGNLVVLTGEQAIAAACLTATRAQLGEMVLASTSGIPNFSTVWAGQPDYKIWESYLQATLENVQGVTQVISLTISAKNNTLSYTAIISTQYGNQTIYG